VRGSRVALNPLLSITYSTRYLSKGPTFGTAYERAVGVFISCVMEMLSVIIAIPPLAELLVRLAPKIVRLVQAYRHADETVAEKAIEFEDHNQKLRLELEEFRQLSPELPADMKRHIGRLFVTLQHKLSVFEMELDDFLQSRHVGIKVVLSSLTKIIDDVQRWQRRVEDYLELLSRCQKPFQDPRVSDQRTAIGRVRIVTEAILAATEKTPESLNLTKTPLPQGLVKLPHSAVMVSAMAAFQPTGVVILETKVVAPDVTKEGIVKMQQDIMDLARVLSAEDMPTRGILTCRGYRDLDAGIDGSPGRQFALEFQVPPQLGNPTTLRAMLVDKDFEGKTLHPLNERLRLAKQLARAVLHVHSKKHVHKNIRPDTILLFEEAPSASPSRSGTPHPGNEKGFPASLGTAFLIGFQRVRKDEADTTPIQDTDWSENIYRHPSRQGAGHAEDKFSMLHDIYSLGVCLLEIAMWRSFVGWDANGLKINNTKGCNLMEPAVAGMDRRLMAPGAIQTRLIKDAKRRVPIVLGERYSRVVVRCLECVESFGTEAEHDPFIGLR